MGLAKVYNIKFKLNRECEIIVFISQIEVNILVGKFVKSVSFSSTVVEWLKGMIRWSRHCHV